MGVCGTRRIADCGNHAERYLGRMACFAEKGLDEEYETLSAELLKNIRLAVLYAINEW